MAQAVFQRYEKKYIITNSQYDALMERLAGRMKPDRYGSYTIYNIYYDTDRFDLIRASIEKPVYKEKLRLRSYGNPGDKTPVFLELKKKYKGVVHKRRAILPYEDARAFVVNGGLEDNSSQILKEIRHFLELYSVSEKVLICYDRAAMAGIENTGLRVTFDSNILFRQTELKLNGGAWGTSILEPGKILMEIKITGAFPMWMSRALSELGIFPASFSKYGTCYTRHILSNLREKGVGMGA